jgi:hypothetical protein
MVLWLAVFTAFVALTDASPAVSKIPTFSSNDKWIFSESFHSEINAKSSGNTNDFSFPDPSKSSENGTLTRNLTILSTDKSGLPVKFAIAYSIEDSANPPNDSPVVGRSFVVDLAPTVPVVSSGVDNGAVPDTAREFVIRDSRRMIDYFIAMRQFAGLNIGTDQEQDLPVGLGCRILGIPQSEVGKIGIKLMADRPALKYSLTIVSNGDKEQQIVTQGVLSIKNDWSVIQASLTTSSVKEVSQDSTKIRVEANTSLDIARRLSRH